MLAILVNRVSNVTLSSIKQVLAEVKRGCLTFFGLLHPHSLLDTKGVLAVLEGGDSTKVPSSDPSHWDLICSEFSDVFEKPGTHPWRAIKYETD